MGFVQEFKEFAMKGNVIDMAVGIVIGGAFGKIVTSLVDNVIMPPVGMLMSQVDFKELKFVLKAAEKPEDVVAIKYGLFLNNVLDFLIVALCIFVVIKQMNKLKEYSTKIAGT